MPKPFDATIKDLAALGPADFVTRFGGPTTLPVQLLNVDLSTVTTAADVVFGIGDPLVKILHLDAQASASATKHLDVLAYNALLYRGLPGSRAQHGALASPAGAASKLDGQGAVCGPPVAR